ncbi:hypothetical protein GCM10023192_80980 [Amycolatopsis samaneae]
MAGQQTDGSDEPGSAPAVRARACLDDVAADLGTAAARVRRAVEDGTVPRRTAEKLLADIDALAAKLSPSDDPGKTSGQAR